ncbi:MAG: glycosyltransferase family 4 protein, partial [Sphaerospermopsis kisseleviana]
EKKENFNRLKPKFAVGIRSFEPQYLLDLQMFRSIVDLCVTSGELLKLCSQNCGMEADRVVSIGGGVHPPLDSRQKPEKLKNTITLLYAGRLENSQKRIMDFVPFLEELSKRNIIFVLHIAGVGSQEECLKEKLSNYIEKDRVIFHGWLSREELYERLYPIADCFIHFAEWEGMTIAPREAMAHGVVPIISCFAGLRVEKQFIDGENCLTFPTGNIKSAADCVQKINENPVYFKKLSENAMLSQTGKYSYDGAINAWSEAFFD